MLAAGAVGLVLVSLPPSAAATTAAGHATTAAGHAGPTRAPTAGSTGSASTTGSAGTTGSGVLPARVHVPWFWQATVGQRPVGPASVLFFTDQTRYFESTVWWSARVADTVCFLSASGKGRAYSPRTDATTGDPGGTS